MGGGGKEDILNSREVGPVGHMLPGWIALMHLDAGRSATPRGCALKWLMTPKSPQSSDLDLLQLEA